MPGEKKGKKGKKKKKGKKLVHANLEHLEPPFSVQAAFSYRQNMPGEKKEKKIKEKGKTGKNLGRPGRGRRAIREKRKKKRKKEKQEKTWGGLDEGVEQFHLLMPDFFEENQALGGLFFVFIFYFLFL